MGVSAVTFFPPRETEVLNRPERLRPRWNFAEWFILSQTFLPALLYLPGSQPFRIPIRMASYGISLAALIFWLVTQTHAPRTLAKHPAVPWLIAVVAYLGLMLAHPDTNTLLAGVAQIALILSVLAPAFWAPALVESPARLQRLLWLVLICSGINSFVGVMQVRDPVTWMPGEFSSVIMESELGLGRVVYEGADGSTIIRPPGLLDAPGAVAGPAVFALYLGLIFVVTARIRTLRVVAAFAAVLGAAAIFFTLVRSSLLIAAGMVAVYIFLRIRQRRFGDAAWVVAATSIAITIAFLYWARVGGDNLIDRFRTIIDDDPLTFYYENRGDQVRSGFAELLPDYPFGAGLGRWGMMSNYFGDPTGSSSIWVEIQIPGWIVDGGIPLLIFYSMALAVTIRQQLGVAFGIGNEQFRALAVVILGAAGGLLALCFSYPVFASPLGIQFWFLSGALHGVIQQGFGKTQAGISVPSVRG